jgi:hypothetical protein
MDPLAIGVLGAAAFALWRATKDLKPIERVDPDANHPGISDEFIDYCRKGGSKTKRK